MAASGRKANWPNPKFTLILVLLWGGKRNTTILAGQFCFRPEEGFRALVILPIKLFANRLGPGDRSFDIDAAIQHFVVQ